MAAHSIDYSKIHDIGIPPDPEAEVLCSDDKGVGGSPTTKMSSNQWSSDVRDRDKSAEEERVCQFGAIIFQSEDIN